MALSRKFLWVLVDRDKNEGLPRKFSVSAYPTLLVLNGKQEKIHRFSGFRKADAFVKDLQEGLDRWKLFQEGKEWDTPTPRPEKLTDEAPVSTIPAPDTKVPAGLAVVDGSLWVGQIQKLHRLDPATGEVKETFALDDGTMDLASDGRHLYGVDSGWTAGEPIRMIDPADGAVLKGIVTEANKAHKSYGAKGVAWRDGRLLVLSGMEGVVHEVDPKTGTVLGKVKIPEPWLSGLDFDGTHLVTASKTHVLWADPKTGEIARRLPVNYWIRSLAVGPGVLYAMEQPIFGHDKNHKQIQIWPRQTVIYKISLKKMTDDR